MFLYILIFINSCFSIPSRQTSSTQEKYQAWYLGFDQQLRREDSFWSPKLYYSPAIDNLRQFGSYIHTEENELRNYLKDSFNNDSNSMYPTLEKLLLVLFPSPSGSLSITSASSTSLNTFISRLPLSNIKNSNNVNDIQVNPLTKEIALAEVLNAAYTILSVPNQELNIAKKNNSTEELRTSLQNNFKEYYKKNTQKWDSITLKINSMINKVMTPLLDFMQLTKINPEEKGLIQHAFMKWALMHIDITNFQSVAILINSLSFFTKTPERNNLKSLVQLSESEKLFKDIKVGFSDPDNIYLTNFPFENGSTYAFNDSGEQSELSFPDCTETTIRHFFNYVLKKDNKFKILSKFNPSLKKYYKNATDAKVLGTDTISRTAWNKVVSHIPGAEYSQSGNELKSNISNILHVIEYLITNERKNFQELINNDMVQEKFKNINAILNKIKPISLTESSTINDKYILNNFLTINIRYNVHAFATIQRSNENKKILKTINFDDLNILEYTFLTNFFTFNITQKEAPLFQKSINDITTILDFFKESTKIEKEDLNTFSSYIGRVLSSAIWEDLSVVEKIYQDKNLIELINRVAQPINILNGVQYLRLEFNIENQQECYFTLALTLKEKLLLLEKLRKVVITRFPTNEIKNLLKTITKNKESIKKIIINEQKNNMKEILETIFLCTHLKKLGILESPFNYDLFTRMSSLLELQELDLLFNQLKSPIPKELGRLTNLLKLNLLANQLTGFIPKDFDNLIKLKELNLTGNQLQGFIPKSLEKHERTINPQFKITKENGVEKEERYYLSIANG